MPTTPNESGQNLRQRAEKLFRASELLSPDLTSSDATKELLHELQVHQIELEMQNDELRRNQQELDVARARYFDLYNLAPVGYLTFDKKGLILNANLAAAQMFRVTQNVLLEHLVSKFVFKEDENIFYQQRKQLFESAAPQVWDMRMVRADGSFFWVHLQATTAHDGEYWINFIDITERKLLEAQLEKAYNEQESMVSARTSELALANVELKNEIEEHKKADDSLRGAIAEIQELKERLRAENIYLQREIAQQFNFGELIGQSHAIRHVFTLIEQVADMNATVLLLGETGTGKGVVARAIHAHSGRKARPMITVNCSTLPTNLIESELFGREKGAFTGSDARQMGRFELADGGTIFLDEIGEMPMELQSKLLRVIQDGEFERVGRPHTIKVNVRIIAASNRNLEEEIQSGRFRRDLYYRLNVFPITVPPLRLRVEDISLLVNHFVANWIFDKLASRNDLTQRSIARRIKTTT